MIYIGKHFFSYICNVKKINLHKIQEWYEAHKEVSLHGRWIPFSKIEHTLKQLDPSIFNVQQLGFSTQKRPIYKVDFGQGAKGKSFPCEKRLRYCKELED